jgi:hypothetical protein
MCFSASASFIASGILVTFGIYTLMNNPRTRYFPLACIPLLFAIQQATEGVVWLTLPYNHHPLIAQLAIYAFLICALIVWPLWIPLSVYYGETVKKYKKILLLPITAGLIVALYFTYHLFFIGVYTHISCSHISYILNAPFYYLLAFLYLGATVIPWFLSRIPASCIFGILLAASYCFTYLFYTQAFVSVWCFFSALLSICLAWILTRSQIA